ncbi:MAG: hypothetical protein HYY06_27380 [Deltaproteobacteria bacterium]|nr:hypothetical protein [Deltaproteobacteria bacterium]
MSPHLSAPALEALAHSRPDLATADEREHAAACAQCVRAIADTEALSRVVGTTFRNADLPLPDLDAIVRSAVSSGLAPAASGVRERASRRSLLVAAVIAIVAASAAGVASRRLSIPSVSSVLDLARDGWTVVSAVVHLASAHAVPTLTPLALAVFALFALCLRAIVTGAHRTLGAGGVLMKTIGFLFTILVLLASAPAGAIELRGEWPERKERINLDVDSRPASEVLRRAAEAARLSLVATLPSDPPWTMHVRNTPLEDVLVAVLADIPVVAERHGSLIVVRPAGGPPPAQPEAPPPAPVPAHAAAPLPAIPAPAPAPPPAPSAARPPSAGLQDRVTFGGDAIVRAGERVRDVVTMGGDALIEGEVTGDVVTMGGDIRLGRGAVVHGDLVTMGGDTDVDEGAVVHGDRVRMSGHESGHGARHGDAGIGDFVEDVLSSAASYALLFLLGLVLLGVLPERLGALQRSIVRKPARAAASGVLGFCAAALLIAVLCVTIIGIPAAVLLAIALSVALYVGMAASATVIGAILPVGRLKDRPVLQLAAGVTALYVVSIVPLAGTIVVVAAVVVGLGAVILTKLGKVAPGDAVPVVPEGPYRTPPQKE